MLQLQLLPMHSGDWAHSQLCNPLMTSVTVSFAHAFVQSIRICSICMRTLHCHADMVIFLQVQSYPHPMYPHFHPLLDSLHTALAEWGALSCCCMSYRTPPSLKGLQSMILWPLSCLPRLPLPRSFCKAHCSCVNCITAYLGFNHSWEEI